MSASVSKLFEAVFTVLKGDAAIIALVPEANIRPAEDPTEPSVGNVIHYNWSGGRWDKKADRGEGTLVLTVSAVDNHQQADEIMDLVREALTARALTYQTPTVSPVRVHLFREEDDGFTDTGTTPSKRFEAATAFSVKFVEAS